MAELSLTPDQEAEAQALFQRLKRAFEREALSLARLMASKEDSQVLGRTEFEVRDQVHRLGAQVLETVLQERKKRIPGGEYGLSRLCHPRAVRGLSGQNDREFAGTGALGAALLPLYGVWAGMLSLGWRAGGDDGLEPRRRRSSLCRRGAHQFCRGQ